jgi:pilus assembly protein Flp/PilA
MIYKLLKSLSRDESGQDLIEYALIAALIAVALVTSMGEVANAINGEFSKVIVQLN